MTIAQLDYIADPQLRAHLEAVARRECAKALEVIRKNYRPSAPIEAIVIASFAHGAAWAFTTDAELGDVATVEDIAEQSLTADEIPRLRAALAYAVNTDGGIKPDDYEFVSEIARKAR